MKKTILCFISCLSFYILAAQSSDSSAMPGNACPLRISLLTCSPGSELYSTFGHSALRVVDKTDSSDIIYNYGTFDFDDPDFYSKFTRGKLLYFVSLDKFENFLYQYEYEQRGITEQVLNLSCEAKEKLLSALNENAREENKYYKYDFVNDNCTTRLRDIVFKYSGSPVTSDIRPHPGVTFRHLIHEYLDKSHQYWSKLGIDILLGSPLDKKINNSEAMFLPDYLLKAFDSTTAGSQPLVTEKKQLLTPHEAVEKSTLFTPFVIFSLLLLIILLLGFVKKAGKFLLVFDFLFFFICGALGILLLFMWFGTDHPTCRNNFNLAWAFPVHAVVAFFLFKKRNWIKKYLRFTIVLLLLLLIGWAWLPQELNNGLLPVVGLLLLRSYMRLKKMSHGS